MIRSLKFSSCVALIAFLGGCAVSAEDDEYAQDVESLLVEDEIEGGEYEAPLINVPSGDFAPHLQQPRLAPVTDPRAPREGEPRPLPWVERDDDPRTSGAPTGNGR